MTRCDLHFQRSPGGYWVENTLKGEGEDQESQKASVTILGGIMMAWTMVVAG